MSKGFDYERPVPAMVARLASRADAAIGHFERSLAPIRTARMLIDVIAAGIGFNAMMYLCIWTAFAQDLNLWNGGILNRSGILPLCILVLPWGGGWILGKAVDTMIASRFPNRDAKPA